MSKKNRPEIIRRFNELSLYSIFNSVKLFVFKAFATRGFTIWNKALPGISTTVAINTATA